MNDVAEIRESFEEVKILKPTPVRLCPVKRYKKSLSSSSASSSNSGKGQNMYSPESLVNLDEISMQEINDDFLKLEENLEEELMQNELLNILNSPKNCNEGLEERNIPKIKRCENPDRKNLKFMKDSYFESVFNELDILNSSHKQ